MTFRNRLQYFLVKKLKISNKNAFVLIETGQIELNGNVIFTNIEINETDSIKYKNTLLQEAKKIIYIAYYKPRGIETTLNINIENNLFDALQLKECVFPVGRLDKESEGLLLLTNNGKIFDKTLRAENHIEKEYLVTVDKPIAEYFISQMATGVVIMGQTTKKAVVEKLTEFEFKIILIQGLNRQIRRMCYKLGYEVKKLVRIRIGPLILGDLAPNEMRYIDYPEN